MMMHASSCTHQHSRVNAAGPAYKPVVVRQVPPLTMAVTRAVRQPLMTLLMGTPTLKEQVDTLPGSRVRHRQEAPVVRGATLASV